MPRLPKARALAMLLLSMARRGLPVCAPQSVLRRANFDEETMRRLEAFRVSPRGGAQETPHRYTEKKNGLHGSFVRTRQNKRAAEHMGSRPPPPHPLPLSISRQREHQPWAAAAAPLSGGGTRCPAPVGPFVGQQLGRPPGRGEGPSPAVNAAFSAAANSAAVCGVAVGALSSRPRARGSCCREGGM